MKKKMLFTLINILLLSSCNVISSSIVTSSSDNENNSIVSSSSSNSNSSNTNLTLEKIEFEDKVISLKIGETYKVKLKTTPNDFKIYSGVYYTSSNKIATIENGIISAKSEGVCRISFEYEDFKTTMLVNVRSSDEIINVTDIKLNTNELNLNKGDTYTLKATLLPENTTEKALIWESSNENIAIVNDGKIEALSKGTCLISAYSSDKKIISSCSLNVVEDEYFKKGYTLSFHDEFNGDSLNTNYWDYDIGGSGWGNNELQYYTNGNNVKLENGELKIIAKRERYSNKEFTSSRIVTRNKVHFKYGYFEAKIKVPSFRGAWPAFWLLGKDIYNNNPWPYCGEIDVMEYANTDNKVFSTLHWNANGKNSSTATNHQYEGKTKTVNDKTQYHIYALDWTEYAMSFYVDNELIYTKDITNKSLDCFHEEFYILFNFAIGGNFVGVYDNIGMNNQSEMTVDYIRVYKKN